MKELGALFSGEIMGFRADVDLRHLSETASERGSDPGVVNFDRGEIGEIRPVDPARFDPENRGCLSADQRRVLDDDGEGDIQKNQALSIDAGKLDKTGGRPGLLRLKPDFPIVKGQRFGGRSGAGEKNEKQ